MLVPLLRLPEAEPHPLGQDDKIYLILYILILFSRAVGGKTGKTSFNIEHPWFSKIERHGNARNGQFLGIYFWFCNCRQQDNQTMKVRNFYYPNNQGSQFFSQFYFGCLLSHFSRQGLWFSSARDENFHSSMSPLVFFGFFNGRRRSFHFNL